MHVCRLYSEQAAILTNMQYKYTSQQPQHIQRRKNILYKWLIQIRLLIAAEDFIFKPTISDILKCYYDGEKCFGLPQKQ